MIIDIFNLLPDINVNINNPYIKALLNKNYGNKCKYFNILKDYKLLLDNDIDVSIEKFLILNKEVIFIPIEFTDLTIYAFQLRSLTQKKFYNVIIDDRFPLCYGFYDFYDYKLGDPIILVEGIKDLYAIKYYYKYALAYMTSQLNSKLYDFLRYNVTSKLYMILDNDKAGRRLLWNEKYEGFNKFLLISKDSGEYFDKMDKNILLQIEGIVNGFVKEI